MKKLTPTEIENFPAIGAVVVTKQVMDEGMRPRFVLRDKMNDENDSGWVVFSGMESDEYTDDANNYDVYAAKTLLKIHPDAELAKILLEGGIGSVFEYDEEEAEWYQVDDYELENDYISTHRMTERWILDINNLFIRKVEEEGSLLYTTGDKSVRINVWGDEKSTPKETLARYKKDIDGRDESESKTLEKFDLSDEKVARIGFMIQEKDERRTYNVIYGFTFYADEVIQSVFYFDHPEDKEWALETWKSIRLVEDK